MHDISRFQHMLASDAVKADEEEILRIRTCNDSLQGDDLKTMLINWLDLLRNCHEPLASLCLSQGKLWEMDDVVNNVKPRKKGECFKNAAQMAFADNGLTYVEGYACPAGIPVPTRHAWVVNHDGLVVDNTWKSGQLYLGLPVNTSTLGRCIAETGCWGVFDYNLPDWVLSELFSGISPIKENTRH